MYRRISIFIVSLIILLHPKQSISEPKSKVSTSRALKVYGKVLGENASKYRVVAVQKGGIASAAKIRPSGNFRFTLPKNTAKGTTLQIVSESGQYQGPVVSPVGDKAATQLSGKKSGNLGSVQVKDGFATVSKKGTALFNKSATVDFSSRTGTPGSGKLGLVEIIEDNSFNRNLSIKVSGQTPGADTDDDGLINLIDVDDDGDLILDGADADFFGTQGPRPYVFNDIPVELNKAINANAGQAVTPAILDEFIKDNLNLVIGFNSGENTDVAVGDANVDCLSLPYCGTGGSAIIQGVGGISLPSDLSVGSPWIQYDPDNDGFPNLYTYPSSIRREIIIKPSVTTDEIGPGDTLIVKIPLNGVLKKFPMVLSSVYATVPAAISYSDGVASGAFSYPVSANAPGTSQNPIQLSTGNLTLTYWRPQRRAIEGAESGLLIDMGKLKYGTDLAVGNDIINCLAEDYSNLSSTLSTTTGIDNDFLIDSSSDSAPDSTKSLSFTLNLTTCISRAGVSPTGKTLLLGLRARDRSFNNATEQIHFRHP